MKASELARRDFAEVATACPMKLLDRFRHETPMINLVSDVPELNCVLVTRADAVVEVSRKDAVYSSQGHPQARRFDSNFSAEVKGIFEAEGWPLVNVLTWSDGAVHKRQRRLLDIAFSPPVIKAKADRIEATVRDLIGGFPPSGKVEFVEDFARRLPTLMVMRELGLQAEHTDLVIDATGRVSLMLNPGASPEIMAEGAHAAARLQKVLFRRIEEVRAKPEDNLFNVLVHAKTDDEPSLSPDELMSLTLLLLVAGSHTTAAMLAWCAYCLAEHPQIHQRLRREPEKIADFVEEVLRVHGPVPTTYRRVTQDTVLAGVELPAETVTLIRWDSVNTDDTIFAEPERFDIDRPNVRAHMSFGFGKHFCLGTHLARLELNIATAALVREFARVEFTIPKDDVPLLPSFDVHMLTALPLRFTR